MDLRKIVAILLVLIALFMGFLSIKMGILAPGLTGVGFILIAVVFFQNNSMQ